MTRQNITVVITILIVVLCGLSIWRTLRPISDKFETNSFVGSGQGLADTTAQAVQNRGEVVAVITTAHQEQGSSLSFVWDAFRAEFKKHAGITLTIQMLPPDQGEGVPGCSSVAFKEILEQHSQASAIVFFMSLPDWRWLQTKVVVPHISAKVIVLAEAPPFPKSHYTGYFTSGILSGLITQRRGGAPNHVPKPKTPREWFHNEYQIFTPQNYESLPE
ncbi:MAG: hypothetical protein PCFJNLEI_00805 [Verrucomicrobiae bacterium]|nr:hypothetical protein [Verrucomicrobiae bacterium]